MLVANDIRREGYKSASEWIVVMLGTKEIVHMVFDRRSGAVPSGGKKERQDSIYCAPCSRGRRILRHVAASVRRHHTNRGRKILDGAPDMKISRPERGLHPYSVAEGYPFERVLRQ